MLLLDVLGRGLLRPTERLEHLRGLQVGGGLRPPAAGSALLTSGAGGSGCASTAPPPPPPPPRARGGHVVATGGAQVGELALRVGADRGVVRGCFLLLLGLVLLALDAVELVLHLTARRRRQRVRGSAREQPAALVGRGVLGRRCLGVSAVAVASSVDSALAVSAAASGPSSPCVAGASGSGSAAFGPALSCDSSAASSSSEGPSCVAPPSLSGPAAPAATSGAPPAAPAAGAAHSGLRRPRPRPARARRRPSRP